MLTFYVSYKTIECHRISTNTRIYSTKFYAITLLQNIFLLWNLLMIIAVFNREKGKSRRQKSIKNTFHPPTHYWLHHLYLIYATCHRPIRYWWKLYRKINLVSKSRFSNTTSQFAYKSKYTSKIYLNISKSPVARLKYRNGVYYK